MSLQRPKRELCHTIRSGSTEKPYIKKKSINLLPTGSEERKVFGVGSIPAAILPSIQNVKIIALQVS